MFGTVQTVTVPDSAMTGHFTLAGSAPIPFGSASSAVQTALVGVYGNGNVIVCASAGLYPNRRGSAAATYNVMFVGALWATEVPPMAVTSSTSVMPVVQWLMVPERVIRLFQDTVDIYKPVQQTARQTVQGMKAEAPDLAETPIAIYKNVPAHYQPTENYSEPKGPGLMKEANLLTADKWTFLIGQELWDRYMIVMRTPGHALEGFGWYAQANSMVNDAIPGRNVGTQYTLAVVAPLKDVPHAFAP